MAWQYRKRVKVAPGVYMNITKNGISTSVGVRGASMTFGKNGTYLNTGIPGTGFYKRQRIGGPATPRVSYSHPSTPTVHSKSTYTFTGVLCACAAIACLALAPIGLIGTVIFAAGTWANFSNRKKYYSNKFNGENDSPSFIAEAKAALASASDERQKKILSNFIATVETIDAIEDEEHILESLNKKPEKNAELIASHSAELAALKNKLEAIEYDADKSVSSVVLTSYENMCQSFEQLLTSQKIWVQRSKVQNLVAKSSAASLVDLKETTFGVGVFNYIKSKFDVPVIPLDSQLLYLYPEFAILSTSPCRFEIINYNDITLNFTTIRFNEPGVFPTDAERIGSTWEYVNKNGGPDRRYANNRQISIVKYGGITLSAKGHGTTTFQISNADLANAFCSNFNRFAGGIRTEKPLASKPSPTPAIDSISKSSLYDVIQAADRIFNCMVDMSNDRQVIAALDNQKQLDDARNLNLANGLIDSRFAVLAANDFIKCSESLGHSADMSTLEGKALGLLLSRIVAPDNAVWSDENMMRRSDGQKALESAYSVFKKNVNIQFDPDKLLSIEMLRHEGVDEEIVNRFAVLLYRYVLLVAKIDGYISESEQKWLANILSFTQNNSVKTTKYNSVSEEITLSPNRDSLFEEAARFLVKSGNTASTSSLQRRFAIGYNRAGLIMDQLESSGIVGPATGSKPRSILIDSIELEELLRTGKTSIDTIEEVPSTLEEAEPTPAAKSAKKAQTKNVTNPMKELGNLIGLSSVKTEITNIYNLVKIQKVRAAKGLNAPDISYHCVFTGNPGTGKTTVARLVAQIYKKLGILSKGHLVETDRSGLVAEYVGQTAVKTNKIIDSALDGVLFIDEAYSLVQNGGGNDYGLEAIATLLKRMEDNRDRLVVILAGYSDEMKQFIDSNPGLQSRFNRYIHFEDYSSEELTLIYEFNLSKFDYRLTDEAATAIRQVMAEAVANKDKNFGNARFVRNFFEKTIERQAKRLASSSLSSLSEDALTEITAEDIK